MATFPESPPIMPYGRISQVRFETSAFFRGPSHGRRGLKRWSVYAPAYHGLPPASPPGPSWQCAGLIKPAIPPGSKEAAECPEPLCPTLALPPLGRCDFHLLRESYLSVFALTGSCATPVGLSSPSALSLVRRVFAGCTQSLLPTGRVGQWRGPGFV